MELAVGEQGITDNLFPYHRTDGTEMLPITSMIREGAEEGLLSWTGESDIVPKTRLLNSLAPKTLLVAVAAGAVLLVGGVANADPSGGSQDTGSGSPIGGLLPGAGGLDLGRLVGPILQPILGVPSGGTGGLDLGQLTGPLLGGLGS